MMEAKARITKELQEAYKNCSDENCNKKCPASMSNGNCFFEYVELTRDKILNMEVSNED